MRLRVLDGNKPTWVDRYGLNAYLYDSKNDRKTRYDRVLFSTTKSGADKVADLEEGEWADVKVTINTADALNGKTGAFLIKVERLDSDLSHVRLFHTSVTRAIATWPGWSERGFTGTFEDYVAERFPSSQAGDFAVLEAGIVSEDTYIEQGEYWAKLYHPLIKYVLDKYRPDVAWSATRARTRSSTSSSAWSPGSCPTARTTRPMTTSTSTARGTAASRRASIHRGCLRGVRRDDAARPGVPATTAT